MLVEPTISFISSGLYPTAKSAEKIDPTLDPQMRFMFCTILAFSKTFNVTDKSILIVLVIY